MKYFVIICYTTCILHIRPIIGFTHIVVAHPAVNSRAIVGNNNAFRSTIISSRITRRHSLSSSSFYSCDMTTRTRIFQLHEADEDLTMDRIDPNELQTQEEVTVNTPPQSNDKRKKHHTMTVCMVPNAKYVNVWSALTKARVELRDPGLFRWPPHANILYPFYEIQCNKEDDETLSMDDEVTLSLLSDATTKCEPFRVSLTNFGTFGGNKRGVLYLYPSSFRCNTDNNSPEENDCHEEAEEPLVELQSLLQSNIPECDDQKKNGKYTPHITLSHFKTLSDAIEGQKKIEEWWEPIEFDVHEIYLLKRIGDDGQFQILATLPLGKNNAGPHLFPQLVPFPTMPLIEEDWVRQERMALKARRNGSGNRKERRNNTSSSSSNSGSSRKKQAGGDNRGPSRSRDTPEEISKKRAERALKRQRLAQEAAEIEAAIQLFDIEN